MSSIVDIEDFKIQKSRSLVDQNETSEKKSGHFELPRNYKRLDS